MKAIIISKLKPKRSGNEDGKADRKTDNLLGCSLTTGSATISRAKDAIGSQQQHLQNSTSCRSFAHQPAPRAESDTVKSFSRVSSRPLSLTSDPRNTPINPSYQQTRCREDHTTLSLQTDVDRPANQRKLLPKIPVTDVDDPFGEDKPDEKTGRSFGHWGHKKTGKLGTLQKAPGGERSSSANFLHRRLSGTSMYKAGTESQISSTASSLSISSQASLSSNEDKEYCRSRQSWTQIAEVDLVANLSVQERTRQEVLFEIVSSEERYVLDLIKLKETFIDRLIPAEAEKALRLSTNALLPTWSRHSDTSSSAGSQNARNSMPPALELRSPSPTHDLERACLPIAAQFATGLSLSARDLVSGGIPDPKSENEQIISRDIPESPPRCRTSLRMDDTDADATVRIKRTYHTLPRQQLGEDNGKNSGHYPGSSPSRQQSEQALNTPAHFYGSLQQYEQAIPVRPCKPPHLPRQISTSPPAMTCRSASSIRKRLSSVSASVNLDDYDAVLPADFRIVLQVISEKLLKGHVALSDALRKRYDEQYPLVRGLADIFIEHSYIFREYTSYVIHLDKALQQLDDCLVAASSNKKRTSGITMYNEMVVGTITRGLNDEAATKGETGLAIALSKPFQRLLKYPLLFQNLLFNTDATISEYNSCMKLLDEVNDIFRSMEDEKESKDDNERTRDALARINGLDRDPDLSLPCPSRFFVGEHVAPLSECSAPTSERSHRRSFRRLSGLIQGHSQPAKEIWQVLFTDVTLLCQKVGTTAMPIHRSISSRTDEKRMPARRKSIRSGRCSRQIETRNLYQFLSVKDWHPEHQLVEKTSQLSDLRSQCSSSSASSIPHDENIKEENVDEAESSSDDSEQMKFVLGASASRYQ
ncbi:hypothetical protein NliqN6_1959 [Naganishia liquefaciens]|uniref:DH domain-containing protein n=1 Tax=Naganishia liquefaciens TaxID=104408 RepID=A0A8H3YET0_9TREE|nr:hypothetical protein NliqN6_1959 [Naganishia liquefaciens]